MNQLLDNKLIVKTFSLLSLRSLQHFPSRCGVTNFLFLVTVVLSFFLGRGLVVKRKEAKKTFFFCSTDMPPQRQRCSSQSQRVDEPDTLASASATAQRQAVAAAIAQARPGSLQRLESALVPLDPALAAAVNWVP